MSRKRQDAMMGGLPSMGLTLIFSCFGFGADRFYVGQFGWGIALLIGYLTVFGAAIAVPIEWLSSLSLVFAILAGRKTAFMYGQNVEFQTPTTFDKVMAILWILLMIISLALFITLIVVADLGVHHVVTP